MCIFAKPILKLLFPNACDGTIMLQISAWSIILIVMLQTINGTLQGLGKVNIPVLALFIGTIVKIVLNVLLINNAKICVNGAIISSLASHTVVLMICFIYLIKYTNINFNFKQLFLKPIIATGIMSIISYLIYVKLNISIIITILIGMIIYGILIIVLRILTKEELFMIPYGQKAYKARQRQKTRKPVKSRTVAN